MKKYFTIIILFTSLLLAKSYAQGVSVNTDGSIADASAMLDVKSTTKGILIPRVNLTSDVTSPVTGLLVFQTTVPVGFYYYSGAVWLLLQNSGNVISATNGGAGTVNGILKANGSGTVSAAVAGTDYLTPSGNASTATLASTVTTNANLTGAVTSVGNATSYNNVVPANKGGAGTLTGVLQANGLGTVSSISMTGSGSVVLASSPVIVNPTLTNPALGTPSALVGTNITGTAASLTAGTVTTNANLTGDVTSSGNATTIANTSTGGTHIVTAINNASTTGIIAAARLGTGATSTNFLRGDGTFATPAGGSSATALTFISSLLNLAYAGNPTLYFNPNDGDVVATHTGVTYTGANDFADKSNIIIPFACTISSLTVTSNTIYTGTGSDNTAFTVYKNGAAQAMTCTVSNTNTVGNVSSVTDNTHTFTVAAGDRISISFHESNANGVSAPYISYGVVLRTQ
jgi:hypothetical protein